MATTEKERQEFRDKLKKDYEDIVSILESYTDNNVLTNKVISYLRSRGELDN